MARKTLFYIEPFLYPPSFPLPLSLLYIFYFYKKDSVSLRLTPIKQLISFDIHDRNIEAQTRLNSVSFTP
jgi:hypothetical protein